jgi:hypothetical protein
MLSHKSQYGYHLQSTYYIPGVVLRCLHVFFPQILTKPYKMGKNLHISQETKKLDFQIRTYLELQARK